MNFPYFDVKVLSNKHHIKLGRDVSHCAFPSYMVQKNYVVIFFLLKFSIDMKKDAFCPVIDF